MSEELKQPKGKLSRRALILGSASSLIPSAEAQDLDPNEPVDVTDFFGIYGTQREREQAVVEAWNRVRSMGEGATVYYLPKDQQKHMDFVNQELRRSTEHR